VSGIDRHHLWGDVLERTAVGVFALDVPAGEETDVGVHAEVSVHVGPHVGRPAEAGRVHGTLHAPVPGADDVDLGAADLPVVGAVDGGCERVHAGLA
jgi:hypothetical protein